MLAFRDTCVYVTAPGSAAMVSLLLGDGATLITTQFIGEQKPGRLYAFQHEEATFRAIPFLNYAICRQSACRCS